METSSFWLISIEESYAGVSLMSFINGQYRVTGVGPSEEWSSSVDESLDVAIDKSLSSAGSSANLPEDQEPSQSAFVLPPFWVGSDGRIVAHKLKLIEHLCKNLNLKPIGFISNDEAIVEDFNQSDGFPASFILLHLGKNDFTLSLAYLGHIKERIKKNFEGDFDAKYIESALLELKSESTLPPQIIVFGQVNHNALVSLKNYAWVGKKDIETFLHFPEVKYYQPDEIVGIFAKTIISQMNPQAVAQSYPVNSSEENLNEETEEEDIQPEADTDAIETEPESESESEENNIIELTEVSSDDLGFSVPQDEVEKLPIIDAKDLPLFNQPEAINDVPEKPAHDFHPPKINFKIPRVKFSSPSFVKKVHPHKFLFLLAFIPLLALIPLFLSRAKITLFVTPYTFNKQIPVTLNSNVQSIDIAQGSVPVTKKEFTVNASTSDKTTGQKTIGEKAKGSLVIFNILSKTQNIPRGSILTDSSGNKFELSDPVSVAAGSFDISAGILKPGQTTAVAQAFDIGPEYNISKDTKLQFKDFAENSLVAKAADTFTGGTKRQINAVSDQDKKNLGAKIDQAINDSINTKINTELSNIPGIIKETIQSKKNQVDYSREVGEEADDLSVTADASVSVFVLDESVKEQIINSFLSKEPDFSQAEINPSAFNFSFKIDKIDNDTAKATLVINGQALPKIDVLKLKKELIAKTNSGASKLIKKEIQRAYDFNIKSNFGFLMPFQSQNITIDVQTESL